MKFEIDGKQYDLIQKPTFGQARMIERETGQPFSALGEIGAMQALIWISMRPTNPGLKFSDLDDMEMPQVDVPEETAAPEPASGPRPTAAASRARKRA